MLDRPWDNRNCQPLWREWELQHCIGRGSGGIYRAGAMQPSDEQAAPLCRSLLPWSGNSQDFGFRTAWCSQKLRTLESLCLWRLYLSTLVTLEIKTGKFLKFKKTWDTFFSHQSCRSLHIAWISTVRWWAHEGEKRTQHPSMIMERVLTSQVPPERSHFENCCAQGTHTHCSRTPADNIQSCGLWAPKTSDLVPTLSRMYKLIVAHSWNRAEQ